MKSILKVFSPFDQKPISEYKKFSENEAQKLLENAHNLFLDRKKWLPKYERVDILERVLELYKKKSDKLILDACREGGKPYLDSKVEIERGLEGIKIALRELYQMKGTEIPMNLTRSSVGRLAYTRLDPRGVVLAISAFNHPVNLIIHQVIPAVATGCPIIIKPSSYTPNSCKNIIEILYEGGLPKDYCQMIICDSHIAQKMVSDPRISFLSFIGSAGVGWHLRSLLSPGATCALEHGGVAPVILDETADLSSAIPSLLKGGYYHAGQVCVSVQRVFLNKKIEDEFIEEYVKAVKKLKVGDPLKKDTEVGPLISPKEVNRVHSWVRESKGKILCGGKKKNVSCYEPTVVKDPLKNSKLSMAEIFGPVVATFSFNKIQEAIRQANAVDFAFQAAIFSNDLKKTLMAIQELNGLTTMVNDHTAFRVDWMPFGGYRKSGMGLGGIGQTMKEMCLEKTAIIKYS